MGSLTSLPILVRKFFERSAISLPLLVSDGVLICRDGTVIGRATVGDILSPLTGLLRYIGNTACAANPNYPAATKGDAYIVTSAGKIGGAAGVAVNVGDVYAALANNAGGNQAAVGASWFLVPNRYITLPTYLGEYTWTALLAIAAPADGSMAQVTTGMGLHRSLWIYSGTMSRWVPAGGGIILGASGAAASCPVNVTENVLATITVPKKSMGPNGCLRIWTGWSMTGSTNAKTPRIRFSGPAGTIYSSLAIAAGTSINSNLVVGIQNRNGIASQVAVNDIALNQAGTIALPTSAVDTDAADTTISITGQKASGGEALTLESYLVELRA